MPNQAAEYALCVFYYRENWFMESSFDESMKLLNALSADIEYCYDKLEKEDSQFWRRTYIRAVFAFAESFIFRMKQAALDINKLHDGLFNEAEVAFLQEADAREYIINRKGEVEAQARKRLIPFESNFKFAFKVYGRAFNSSYTPDLGDGGWDAFREALEVRHRLTHPKFIHQLDISDDELERIEKGVTWFRKVTLELFQSGSFPK
jgi:hypothetical protein